MYISRVTITGFKSFATKTSFTFKPGVSAIVGPNGSGKSNVADAVKWVFGEQSARSLRVKKSEDVIFAGTGNKARGSMAEVQLIFDNADGALAEHGAEVQVSRKLYGSGESEYRVSGKKVRLQDVLELLAQARVGAGSYAIIGQGTIDLLIMSTPAERKLLFEEASGIRAFEIKREQAMRRLNSTAENIDIARKLLAELKPRLAHLERSLEAVKQREQLAVRVGELKVQIEVANYQEWRRAADVGDRVVSELTREIEDRRAQVTKLTKELTQLSESRSNEQKSRQAAGKSLDKLEAEREHLVSEASLKRAELSHLEERQVEGEALLKQLERLTHTATSLAMATKELEIDLSTLGAEQRSLQSERQKSIDQVKKVQTRLVQQRKQLSEDSPYEYIVHAQAVLQELSRAVGGETVDMEAIKLLAYKIRRLLTLAAKEGQGGALEELKQLQIELTGAIRAREVTEERYTDATLRLRGQELKVEAAKEQAKHLSAEQKRLSKLLAPYSQMAEHSVARAADLEHLQERLAANRVAIDEARQLLHGQTDDDTQVSKLSVELEKSRYHIERIQGELGSAERQRTELAAKLRKIDPQLLKRAPKQRSTQPVVTLERELVVAESRLQTLQEMDAHVAEEHTEVATRHSDLTRQIEDLHAAHSDLIHLIEQLDAAIMEQFESGFHQISEGFSRTFTELFGGGSARLVLDKSEDGLGVEIEVSPPGKRVKNLRALSGGERSMAGIALLTSIIRAHPSPVLILDEVDAALDEVNSQQFQRLLISLSSSSQIVVITHNRQTMTAAQRLYGVSMDKHHVSRMVAVELPQAQEMAEATS
jgi:chromosome segregation ATPase